MKAFILSAGYGTRLRPVTNHIPKALVPIGGKPLLEYWLDNLSSVGIEEFLINTHYMPEKIIDFVEKSKFKNCIKISHENILLNTAGSLLANKSFFNEEPFMLIHGDNLSFCNFNNFIDSHINRPTQTIMTMMLFRTNTPEKCGIVEVTKNGVLKEFFEKITNPPSNLANAAVYICEYSIFNILEKLNRKNFDFSIDVIPNLLNQINTFINNTYHRDIGSIEDYALAQIEILNLIQNNTIKNNNFNAKQVHH